MQRLERFESAAQPSLMQVTAGSCIRVCHGALWLTLEGQPDDIWLAGGEQWVATGPAKLWISGEPHVSFELLHPVAPRRSDAAWARSVQAVLATSYRTFLLSAGRRAFT